MSNCTCATSAQNLGIPNCEERIKYAAGIIIVSMNDDAGVANAIANGTTLNSGVVTTKLNLPDASQRWFLIKNIKNAIIAERSEDVNETFEDGSSKFIEEGVATSSFIIASQSPTMVGKLKSHRCNKNGFYFYDKDGKLFGIKDTGGNLYPIAIEDETWSVKAAYPTATTGYNIPVTFKWRKDMADEDLGYWDNTVNWSLSTVTSILDVNVVVSNESLTGFTLTLTSDFGAVNGALPIEGLVITDFISSVGGATSKIRKTNNTPADVSITSVTESADGVYDFVIPTATTGDILQPKAIKNGFDFSNLLDVTVVIP